MKNVVLFLIICITALSCQRDKDVPLISHFKQKMTCQLKELNFPNDSLGQPDFIYSFDDYIILSEPKLDYLLTSFNISNQNFSRFLRKGNGPDELLDVQQIAQAKEENSFFVKSTFAKNFFIYTVSNGMITLQSKMPIPENWVSSFWDENIIISSQYGNNRYSIYNIDDKINNDFGSHIDFNDYEQNIVSHILQGSCAGSISQKKFAWFSIYGDAFEIFDYNESSITTIKQFIGILPSVSIDGGNPVVSLDTKLGIPSLVSNDKYIFALYNEKTLRDALTVRDDVLFSNKILIYDWNGRPVKILQTNTPLRAITYNRQTHTLYCIGYNEHQMCRIYYIDDIDDMVNGHASVR